MGALPFGVAVDETTDKIYVPQNSGTVSVIHGATDKIGGTVHSAVGVVLADPGVGGPVAVDQTTNTIYVASCTLSGGVCAAVGVSAIDGATNTVTATVVTGGSGGLTSVAMAVDEATDTVYVANRNSDWVSVIDGPRTP